MERLNPFLPRPLWRVIKKTPGHQGGGVVLSAEGQVHPMQGKEEERPPVEQSATSTAWTMEVQARLRLPRKIPRQYARINKDEGGQVGGHIMKSKVSSQPIHSFPADNKLEDLDHSLQTTARDSEQQYAMRQASEAEKEALLKEKGELQEIRRQELSTSKPSLLIYNHIISELTVKLRKTQAQLSDASKGQSQVERVLSLNLHLWGEEKESLHQEKMRLQKELEVLQQEALELQRAHLASQKDSDNVKAALVQQQAENATLRRAKEEADQALLLLQQSLSEEHSKREETEKMEAMQSQRAEKQKSPCFLASVWKRMRNRRMRT